MVTSHSVKFFTVFSNAKFECVGITVHVYPVSEAEWAVLLGPAGALLRVTSLAHRRLCLEQEDCSHSRYCRSVASAVWHLISLQAEDTFRFHFPASIKLAILFFASLMMERMYTENS